MVRLKRRTMPFCESLVAEVNKKEVVWWDRSHQTRTVCGSDDSGQYL